MTELVFPSIDFTYTMPETGLFFLMSLCLVLLFLNHVQGNTAQLKEYILQRNIGIVKSPCMRCCVGVYIRIVIVIFMLTPLLTLAVWGGTLIAYHRQQESQTRTDGTAPLFLGITVIFFLFGLFRIFWQNYKISKKMLIIFAVSLSVLIAYLFVITLFDAKSTNFFGYSAIFLFANSLFVIFIIFLHSKQQASDLNEIIASLDEGD